MKLIETFKGPKGYVKLWEDVRYEKGTWTVLETTYLVDSQHGMVRMYSQLFAIMLAKNLAGLEKQKETSKL